MKKIDNQQKLTVFHCSFDSLISLGFYFVIDSTKDGQMFPVNIIWRIYLHNLLVQNTNREIFAAKLIPQRISEILISKL